MMIRRVIGVLSSVAMTLPAFAQCEPVEVQRVQPGDASLLSFFGNAVAMSGPAGSPADRAIIGAFLQDGSGAAYVYRRLGQTWVYDGKLSPSDPVEGMYFGNAVGIEGDYAVVGAPGAQSEEGDIPGAAYVFKRANGVWTQVARLAEFPGIEFGSAVAISGQRVMVGDPEDDERGVRAGAVYVYKQSGDEFFSDNKILATDATEEDYFGSAIHLDGDRAIFGALFNDQSAVESGAAYIYLWNGSFWFKQAKIAPSDPSPDKWFGFAVHLVGDLAVVGAPQDDAMGQDAGAAYFFEWDGITWNESIKMFGSNTGAGDYFGNAVGTDGRKILVGGYSNDGVTGPDSGNAYTFIRPGGAWQQTTSLVTAGDSAAFDSFAISIVVRGEWALVGSLGGGDAGLFAGSAYFYNYHAPTMGDATSDEQVNFADITEALTFWGQTYPGGTGPGDANHDGVVNFNDVTSILQNFGASCG
jgi:hypothetical protein